MSRSQFALAVTALALVAGCANRVDDAANADEGPLARSFRLASLSTGVPREVLLGVGYVESRWQTDDGRLVDDDEHSRGGAGIMGLTPRHRTGVDASDADANIRAAAEVLRSLAADDDGRVPKALLSWRAALAAYGAEGDVEAGALYADAVFRVIDQGATAVTSSGETLTLRGRAKGADGKQAQQQQALSADSPYAVQFLSARDGFFHYGRNHSVDRVIIHTTEGSYEGTIGWFRSPNNPYQTSAHYVVRSSDGEVTQMVREQDTAYHVFNWNERAIGIEHEAISAQPQWFTDAMYRSSAALVRDICIRWGIPMDRQHIVGHVEVPGNDHTDPGQYWDWDYYMALVTDGAAQPPPPRQDACNGLDYAGACDGATLQWCEGGALRSVDCAATNEPTCGWQDDATGFNCLAGAAPPPPPAPPADPCHGLDYAGACDGSTLEWCEGGALRSVDCSMTGQPACGWQDDATGFNCVAAPTDPCGGLDYAGTCDGNTLAWCEDGAAQSFDCASTGQGCGWQNDSIGNNCM